MKNNFFIIFFLFSFSTGSIAKDLLIQAKNIQIDKDTQTTIFEDEVNIVVENDGRITSDFAEYNKKIGLIKIKGRVKAIDDKNNVVETEYGEYSEEKKIFKSLGNTKIVTSKGYIIEGRNIILNNYDNSIKSEEPATILDLEKNKISLSNFEYQTITSIFKSIGDITIQDKLNNEYSFSQIYIDTKKKEILGTDIKAFFNNEDFKIYKNNKPRIFSNSFKSGNNKSTFRKSIYTICDYRKNDKCPPWTIQSSKILHDRKKKTVYLDNAIVKVYDIPIFYFPKLAHPDPSVDRRSGFLPPSFTNSKNLGFGTTIPYFFAVDVDKNFTINNKVFIDENPLFSGQYHQVFRNAEFFADFGYTAGYKNTTSTKKKGEKSHLFSKFIKNFKGKNNSDNRLDISLNELSNDKYLKLYKIDSDIVDYNTDTLENYIDFTHEKDDIFFALNASVYENLKDDYNDKYEYILPEISLDKNLFLDEKYGSLNLETNLKFHNYDTNITENFFVNNFNWISKDFTLGNGFKNNFISEIKNINYETKNIDTYKDQKTSELHGAFGFLSELNLLKNNGFSEHLLTPKLLLKYSPGSMRKETDGSRLDPDKAFELNRLDVDENNNYETGISATIGAEYNIKSKFQEFDFSVAQIINEKENKKMHSKTGLDEKLSDLVGSANIKLSKNFNINYNFALDQNYSDLNYNEIGTQMNFGNTNIDLNYLQENKHIGDQNYLLSKININNDSSLVSFKAKRNLVTNSSEFYNLSYEYINDCLRAGLVYRREFYNDSELEPENSLMFKITLSPFGSIDSPSFSQ